MRLSNPVSSRNFSSFVRGIPRMTIQKRLGLVVLLALMPCAALVGIQMWQQANWDRKEEQDRAYDQLEKAVEFYAFRVERAHVAFLDFAFTGLDDRANTLKASVDNIDDAYQKALAADVNGAAASVLDPLTKFNVALKNDIGKVISVRKTLGAESSGSSSGEIKTLLDTGSMVEGTLRRFVNRDPLAIDSAKALTMAASMRRHEARYMVMLDSTIEGEHLVQMDRLSRAINGIEANADEKTKLTTGLASYAKAFLTWQADAKKLRSDFEGIDRSFTIVAPVIEQARNSIMGSREVAELASEHLISRAKVIAIGLTLGSILGSLLVASLMARSLSRPLDLIRTGMIAIAEGNTAIEVGDQKRTDEIGQMLRSLKGLREAVGDREVLARQQVDDAAVTGQRAKQIEEAANDFRRSMSDSSSRLSEAIRALNGASDTMRTGANDLAARARSSGAAADGTRVKATSVAAAAEQMSSSGREIAEQIGRSAEVANRSAEQAVETRGALTSLTDSATRVGQVIELISRIAQQTNLLALNATIEAARAGEAGRGFAVVASEVKQLATETARAADEVSQTVGAMHGASTEVVMSFDMLMSGIGQLRDAADAIASAAHEQEISIGSIAQTMSSLSSDAEIGAAAANEAEHSVKATADIAASIDSMSADLTEIIVHLEDDVRRFVDRLQAA
jgi:methyl-accepting chemotaxis protein